ncbi:YihY/virulence factor BrkB family protein [Amniculibacterium sp. G2-70]|nr:YihY/virulence factor BrkB family protein [Amniculibacterium sp. G2-70]
MFEIYGKGIFRMQIGRMAASISWSFFLSLFPFLLFLLSLLPYLPHYHELQYYIFHVLLHNFFPAKVQEDISNYIEDVINPNIKNLSFLTIFLALIFATNGTHSLINGFNLNHRRKVNAIKEYLVSFAITLSFTAFIIFSLLGLYYSEVVLKLFSPEIKTTWLISNLSKIIGFFSFPLFYFLVLSLFYWLGCFRINSWKQALPGAILTTVLFILLTYFFAVYVKDFARYNVLYGSIGSIILVMVWINLNIILILLGNELNLAIKNIRLKKIEKDQKRTQLIDIDNSSEVMD